MSYNIDFNILVNGNRCKKYYHDGKIWIEAKYGSEYELEIKNNSWERLLAVASVDGLNVISGKAQSPQDASGYIIKPYSSERIAGFRSSDNNVNKFTFDRKAVSYAASKGNGEQVNCGVIGLRAFNEVPKPPPPPPQPISHPRGPWRDVLQQSASWSGGLYGAGRYGYSSYNSTVVDDQYLDWIECQQERSVTSCNATLNEAIDNARSLKATANAEYCCSSIPKATVPIHDMGTAWGEEKYAPVIHTEFDRNVIVCSSDIFYASREALIEMGVPISCRPAIATPQSFPETEYAEPPRRRWRR